MTKEQLKEIAYIAWKGAANAHRLYPDNKHTFVEYWNGAESQFNKFLQADVSKSDGDERKATVCDRCAGRPESANNTLCSDCYADLHGN